MIGDESSDYDIKVDVESIQPNHIAQTNLIDDSNDSFSYDNESSLNMTPMADRRQKPKISTSGLVTSSASSHAASLVTSNIYSSNINKNIDESRLAECLNYLHSLIGRKDKEDIFGMPVTDDIAPGYSTIIKKPMDLTKMKSKIDTFAYKNIMEYKEDLILMCENCMTYNKPDTIYYQAARKMLDYGLKSLSKDKLLSLRTTVRIMRMLTPNELGFSLDADNNVSDNITLQAIKKRAEQTQQKTFNQSFTSRITSNNNLVISKAKEPSKDSYLLPPEGENVEYDEDIAEEVSEVAKEAAENLAAKNKKGKIGFLRRNSNGTIQMHYLDKTTNQQDNEKSVTIGNLCGGLQAGAYSMASFIEDKKNKDKPMHFVENGPFSSSAPVYDTTYTSIPKEDVDFLLSIYGDEASYQYALSLMEFSKGTTPMYNKYVNLVLNTLTNNEHEKYLQNVNRQKQQIKQEETPKISNQEILIPIPNLTPTAQAVSNSTNNEDINEATPCKVKTEIKEENVIDNRDCTSIETLAMESENATSTL